MSDTPCSAPDGETRRVTVTRLPLDVGQPLREIDRVLAGPTRDFEYTRRRLHVPRKHLENGLAVSMGGRRVSLRHGLFSTTRRLCIDHASERRRFPDRDTKDSKDGQRFEMARLIIAALTLRQAAQQSGALRTQSKALRTRIMATS